MASKGLDPNKTVPGLPSKAKRKLDPDKPEPQVVTPRGAKLVVSADNELSDKVAIAGFSVNNFGMFASSETGIGLVATGGQLAAAFEGPVKIAGGLTHDGGFVLGNLSIAGNLTVDGDIQLSGRDYAEDFDVASAGEASPGTVMVLDDRGGLRISDCAYDRRVAGVVSGAGDCRPAVILGRGGAATPGRATGRPLALMGTVWCRADATDEPIRTGDLLTTSATPGHAMKASDSARACGAVIGKAMGPLGEGRGMVPILVTLQ